MLCLTKHLPAFQTHRPEDRRKQVLDLVGYLKEWIHEQEQEIQEAQFRRDLEELRG